MSRTCSSAIQEFPELYRDYLITYHGILRATIPLLQTSRREALARDTPASRTLAVGSVENGRPRRSGRGRVASPGP